MGAQLISSLCMASHRHSQSFAVWLSFYPSEPHVTVLCVSSGARVCIANIDQSFHTTIEKASCRIARTVSYAASDAAETAGRRNVVIRWRRRWRRWSVGWAGR